MPTFSEGTYLGELAQGYIDRGEFVPDEITDSLVKDRLHQEDTQDGFLLDGYPRTLAQVGALDEILLEQGHTLDIVIELVTEREDSCRASPQARRDRRPRGRHRGRY